MAEVEVEVGLWIRVAGQSFLIRTDPQGHPDIEALSEGPPLPDREAKKREAKALYEQITGRPYPYDHAATRQVLWDVLEAAIPRLP